MIQPVITANQAIANKTMLTSPVFVGKMRENEPSDDIKPQAPVTVPVEAPVNEPSLSTDSAQKGEKLDIKFTGCREYSLYGNKVDYFA